MQLNALTAISPIDGRYQDKATALRGASRWKCVGYKN